MTTYRIPTRDDIAPRLTDADRYDMLRRALPLCPDDVLAYAPRARTWLLRQQVPVYEICSGIVARELIAEQERRTAKSTEFSL